MARQGARHPPCKGWISRDTRLIIVVLGSLTRRMGFRESRVELRPLRGLAPLDRLRRSPALRAGRVKSRRPDYLMYSQKSSVGAPVGLLVPSPTKILPAATEPIICWIPI